MGYYLKPESVGQERTSAIFPDTPKTLTPGSRLKGLGLRFYKTDIGRWLNRDPIEENGGIGLYCFVRNRPMDQVDPLGQYYVAMNPPPAWFDSFVDEGKPCCCDSAPSVELKIEDNGTSGWHVRVLAHIEYDGCVSEMRWAWATCDRYTSMSPGASGESGFFPSHAQNIVNFDEYLAPRPILNVWVHAAWLECKNSTWQKKSGTVGHGYDAGFSPNPLNLFRQWLSFSGQITVTY